MKKLMMTLAVSLAATALIADVTSVNVVGYQNVTAGGQYFSSGATFISIGTSANAQWRLGDIKGVGMVPVDDNIQFLSADDANTELTATYVDAATAAAAEDPSLEGWWNMDIDTRLDDQVFVAGTGFLCSFSSVDVVLTYAGEVLDGATTLDLSGMQYPMVANFLPMDITLGDLTGVGMVPVDDNIQFLGVDDANTELTATYVDAETAAAAEDPSLEGWWNMDIDTRLDDVAFPAGTAFLGSFASSDVQIIFPDPIL